MTDVTVTSKISVRQAVRGTEAAQTAALSLLARARRAAVVYAPVLPPAPFNSTALCRALIVFATRHRQNLVRLLVEDAQRALRDNDRLVGVTRRLGDAVKWREVAAEDRGGGDLFIVTDGSACLYLPDRLRTDGEWVDGPDPLPIDLQARFEKLWERSQPAMALNPVGL